MLSHCFVPPLRSICKRLWRLICDSQSLVSRSRQRQEENNGFPQTLCAIAIQAIICCQGRRQRCEATETRVPSYPSCNCLAAAARSLRVRELFTPQERSAKHCDRPQGRPPQYQCSASCRSYPASLVRSLLVQLILPFVRSFRRDCSPLSRDPSFTLVNAF